MKKNIKNNLIYYTFNIFSNKNLVTHCFSTKTGGVSTGNCGTMNLAFRRDTKRDNVYENFKILCNTVGFKYNGIVLLQQEHTANVKRVTKENKGNIIFNEDTLGEIDGVVTNEEGITLATLHADCVPIYFLDPVKRAIGLCHAGWRGTVNSIASNTALKMINEYNCNVKDIIVGIGPSIGNCCFEVDKPVRDEFYEKLSFSSKYIQEANNEKYHIDMWSINKDILINIGILPENIEVTDICTKCNSDIFHSHRQSGFDRGCMVAMLSLETKNEK